MNQDNFVNAYVEILSTTVSEAIQKNLVFQAQKKVFEQNLEELKKLFENEQKASAKLKQDFEELLRQRKSDLVEQKKGTEQTSGADHIETFKNELLKSRKLNEDLLNQMESLKATLNSREKECEDLKNEISKLTKTKSKTAEKTVQDSGKF